jgi:hypothetical protein
VLGNNTDDLAQFKYLVGVIDNSRTVRSINVYMTRNKSE